MKTPISYYGGKQNMLKYILPLIPKHEIYVEAFCGGGAVFWAKEPSKVEVVNDLNGNVVNFYRQLKTNFKELNKLIQETPFSREVYKQAMVIYTAPYLFSPIKRAWSFWIATNQGFSNQIGTWRSSGKHNKEPNLNKNKKIAFTPELSERLAITQMECIDAVKLIERMDTLDTFFYVDPPYVNANQGHYGGYTQAHFDTLLEALSNIKGKFLLSSYPNDALSRYVIESDWRSQELNMALSISNRAGRRKIEVLTANYTI